MSATSVVLALAALLEFLDADRRQRGDHRGADAQLRRAARHCVAAASRQSRSRSPWSTREPTTAPWIRRVRESPCRMRGNCMRSPFARPCAGARGDGYPDGFRSPSWIAGPGALSWRFGRAPACALLPALSIKPAAYGAADENCVDRRLIAPATMLCGRGPGRRSCHAYPPPCRRARRRFCALAFTPARADCSSTSTSPRRQMTVSRRRRDAYTWKVSTGMAGYDTPAASSKPSAWNATTSRASGTTRRCPIRSSSPRKATPSTAASTSSISAARPRMAACGCRRNTPRCCGTWSRNTG